MSKLPQIMHKVNSSSTFGLSAEKVKVFFILSSFEFEIWSSVSEELLDESYHFALVDCSWSVLVESGEYLCESIIREFISRSKVSEGILNELLGLLLVEGTALIDIVGIPDLVDDTLDGLFFSWHYFWKCLVNN